MPDAETACKPMICGNFLPGAVPDMVLLRYFTWIWHTGGTNAQLRTSIEFLGSSWCGFRSFERRVRCRRTCPGCQAPQPRMISAVPAATASTAATSWLIRTRPKTVSGDSRSGSRKNRPVPYQAITANA